ncbi:XisH family protein [Coleofasciculus sp. FACHB-64]|uniref:XisH family protein n=1 Tax=Cyanophyceae TaxID=3028117 RepID=UPI0016894EBD|nr:MULTISPECIES: XisH family protein [unclassified Coleofasciculus]MBD1943087.1 XisH family protein [Coleofasciculus sp. FACHB-712]MBD2045013.1 XisH family protein [Coleofasciculus sp. FACHB-64]
MPQRDAIHNIIRQALIKEGWEITDDPYVISYGERFLFIDLAARLDAVSGIAGRFIGARRGSSRIAVEIKEFRGNSAIADLEQAIGQYVLYRLLLEQVDPDRELYLAIADTTFDEIFSEPIGELVRRELPIKLLIVDVAAQEVKQWIPPLKNGTL